MKNYFEIFKGNEDIVLTLGLEKEYESVKKEWESAKTILKFKLTPEFLSQKIKKILNEFLTKILAMKEKLLREDNKLRNAGHPLEKRNINKIILLEELEKKMKEDLKKKARPIEEWVLSGDVQNIKEYGLDWFLRVFYKRLLV